LWAFEALWRPWGRIGSALVAPCADAVGAGRRKSGNSASTVTPEAEPALREAQYLRLGYLLMAVLLVVRLFYIGSS